MGQDCPGPCNGRAREAWDRYRNALALYDPLDQDQSRPESPEAQFWPGDPIWCQRDAAKVRTALAEVESAAALHAHATDGYGGSSGDQRVSGSPADRSPSAAHDDTDELVSVLLAHERAFRALKGYDPPPHRGELASVLTETVAWLLRRLDDILATADGDMGKNFGADVLRWHRELCGKAKAGQRTLRKPLRCPSCRLLMLNWTEGETEVKCSNPECRLVLPYHDYELAVERAAGDVQDAGAA